jgi:apolipoprotein N-acyltransferase
MHSHRNLYISILGGLALGLAWHLPGNYIGVILTFIAISALIYPFINSAHSYWHSFLYGIVAHSIACYWIIDTVQTFGGYDSLPALGLFSAYVILHALQFPTFILFARILDKTFLNRAALVLPLAWLSASLGSFRLFPWDFPHTMIGFFPLTQTADLGGTYLISFILFLLANSFLLYSKYSQKQPLIISSTLIALFFVYGTTQFFIYKPTTDSNLKASLIQADLSVEEKGNIKFLSANLDKYIDLSLQAATKEQPQLILWPESIISDPVLEPLDGRKLPARFSFVKDNTNFIFGALTAKNNSLYNSAVGVNSDSQIKSVYHKQILMPFGEFMPFADIFPELLALNPNVGNFKAGESVGVFSLNNNIKAAPLICYEDLIPELSAEASQKGANLLVNLTNDAWFGKSAAALQHNLIASYRAIENRRYLLRATNSGLTSVIDWRGSTIMTAPVFSEAILTSSFKLNDKTTIYSKIGGNYLWRIIAYLNIIFAVICWFKFRKSK